MRRHPSDSQPSDAPTHAGGPDPRPDGELVAAANAGAEEAMAALYHRYRSWVFALALRFCGEEHLAADVTQEVFAYLFGKFPGLVLRARLTTFLYPAVKHIALAKKRKRRKDGAGDALETFAGAAPGGELPIAAESLAAAIAQLPDGQREVLLMRAVDDMTMAEIALALGIPEGTAKSRLHHAIRAMQSLLKSEIP